MPAKDKWLRCWHVSDTVNKNKLTLHPHVSLFSVSYHIRSTSEQHIGPDTVSPIWFWLWKCPTSSHKTCHWVAQADDIVYCQSLCSDDIRDAANQLQQVLEILAKWGEDWKVTFLELHIGHWRFTTSTIRPKSSITQLFPRGDQALRCDPHLRRYRFPTWIASVHRDLFSQWLSPMSDTSTVLNG